MSHSESFACSKLENSQSHRVPQIHFKLLWQRQTLGVDFSDRNLAKKQPTRRTVTFLSLPNMIFIEKFCWVRNLEIMGARLNKKVMARKWPVRDSSHTQTQSHTNAYEPSWDLSTCSVFHELQKFQRGTVLHLAAGCASYTLHRRQQIETYSKKG